MPSYNDVLVQPPQLGTPGPGQAAGTAARLALGPAQLTRGVYSLPLPIKVPTERGQLLAQVFPSYSPENGASEWGMGWRADLAIRRHRLRGTIDYQEDEFTSPWGRLVAGDDGHWYPRGLASRVVLSKTDTAWIAVGPDGTTYEFSLRVDTSLGTYAWYLTSVRAPTGGTTALSYEKNASGQPFLTHVTYGALPHPDTYAVDIEYESIRVTVTSYASGDRLELDRRAASVTVSARHADSGDYEARWLFELGYAESDLGPAFYLTSLVHRFRSGESLPPIRYTYDLGDDRLGTAQLEHVPALDWHLESVGDDGLQPTRITMLDIDEDGRLDFEHHYAQTLLRQTDAGFEAEATPVPADAHPRCRPDASRWNDPRRLVRMVPEAAEPHVVYTQYSVVQKKTALLICTRAGEPLQTEILEGNWRPEANIRMVDVNNDGLVDMVKVWRGKYQVLANRSDAEAFAFESLAVSSLDPVFAPNGTWAHDVNGDGLVDLIARSSTGLVVWFGTGRFEFETQGVIVRLYDEAGDRVGSLEQYGLFFVDANNDGLTDILLSRRQSVFLFTNHGDAFRWHPVPGLLDLDLDVSNPVVANVRGTGATEVVFTQGRKAYAISLDVPETGLLTSVDDGGGATTQFAYVWDDAHPGARKITRVLAGTSTEAVGASATHAQYGYAEPVYHSEGRFLVGYGAVTVTTGTGSERATYAHGDAYSDVPVETVWSDTCDPEVHRIAAWEYDETVTNGVVWMRRAVSTAGWGGPSMARRAMSTTRFGAYERGVCPTWVEHSTTHGVLSVTVELTARDELADLGDALHCLSASRRFSGAHDHADLDFALDQKVARNGAGQATEVVLHGSEGPWVLQETEYDDFGRVASVASPDKGQTTFSYGERTGVLAAVIEPTGVLHRRSVMDPITDQVLLHETLRGGPSDYAESYSYDGLERLERYWANADGSSPEEPARLYRYELPSARHVGAVLLSTLVDPASPSRRDTFTWVAGNGSVLARGERSADGLVATEATIENAQTGETTHLARSFLGNVADPLRMGHEALVPPGSSRLSWRQTSTFGHDCRREERMSEGAERTIDSVLTLVADEAAAAAELVHTATENGVYTRRRGMTPDELVVWEEDELLNRTSYTYDALSRLRRVKLANGALHEVDYDDYGRKAAVRRDDFGRVAWGYHAGTSLLQRRERWGTDGQLERATTLAYDAAGRLVRKEHTLAATGTTETFEYEYDGGPGGGAGGQLGWLTAVRGPQLERKELRNPNGLLRTVEVSLGRWRKLTSDYDYFADGSVRTVERVLASPDSSGAVSTIQTAHRSWETDSLGRPWRLSVGGQPLVRLEYRNDGLLARALLSADGELGFVYDAATKRMRGFDRQSAIGTADVVWALNDRGWVSQQKGTVFGQPLDEVMVYDPRGFLAEARTTAGRNEYTYCPAGLPLTANDLLGMRSLVRGVGGVEVGAVEYEFDGLGRVTRKGDAQIDYGPTGRPSNVRRGLESWAHYYDENGARVLRAEDSGNRIGYVAGGMLVEGTFLEPVRVGGLIVGVLDGEVFNPLVADARGVLLGDGEGASLPASPYGVRERRSDVSRLVDFGGGGFDEVLATVGIGVRDYDPYTGQWLTGDDHFLEAPSAGIGRTTEYNLLSYAANNPINFTDPTGMYALPMLHAARALDSGFDQTVRQAMIRHEDRPIESSLFQLDDLSGVKGILTGAAKVAGMAAAGAIGMVALKEGGERIAKEAVEGAAAGGLSATARTGSTTLFRAVSDAEFTQVMRTGAFDAGPNSLGGKFFAGSAADAAKWGEALNGAGNFKLLQVELPTSTVERMMHWQRLDAIGPAWYGELPQLGGATITPYVP